MQKYLVINYGHFIIGMGRELGNFSSAFVYHTNNIFSPRVKNPMSSLMS